MKSWIDPVGTQTCCSTSLVISASPNPFILPLYHAYVRWCYTRFWHMLQLKEQQITTAPGRMVSRCHLSSFSSSLCLFLAASGLWIGISLTADQGPLCTGAMRYCSSSQLLYINRRRRSLSLSAPNPRPVSWKSNFQFKSSMANSRCLSTSCSLAARLASRALSAGIVFDSLLSFTVTGLPQCAATQCPQCFHCFIHNVTMTPCISIQTISVFIKALVISHLCL